MKKKKKKKKKKKSVERRGLGECGELESCWNNDWEEGRESETAGKRDEKISGAGKGSEGEREKKQEDSG